MGKQILVYVLWTFKISRNSWERTSCWLKHVKHAFNLTGCNIHELWPEKCERKKKQPITNLNILLYQTNLDYRCNHQSIQVKLEQNSADLIHVKYTITIQKQNKHYMVHKYTAEEKNKSLHRNVLLSFLFIVDTVVVVGSREINCLYCGWLIC